MPDSNYLSNPEAAKLRELDDLKNTFVTLVSHELRTPLNLINGYLEIGLQELGDDIPPSTREYFKNAQEGAKRLTRIVQELTDFSRLQSGKTVEADDPISLNEAIAQVFTLLRPSIESKALTFSVALLPDIAPRRYDGERLIIIFRNLLSNAAKFSPDGGKVWITSRQLDENTFVIAINDNATPIPPEKQENIFTDFRQLENHLTRRYEGLGLGLAVARRAARVLGGDLSLRVRADGNTFVLTLPIN